MGELLNRFFNDDQVQIMLFMVVLDFLLGTIAALKMKTFRLSYWADFARNDLLFKVIPGLILYGGLVYAQAADVVIPGLDMDTVARTALGIAMAALAASLFGSLRDLGLGKAAPDTIPAPIVEAVAGDDPNSHVGSVRR
jgi:hypothetical protein